MKKKALTFYTTKRKILGEESFTFFLTILVPVPKMKIEFCHSIKKEVKSWENYMRWVKR